jgi:hypothetical protein
MAYTLIESAQTRWRPVNAPQLVALVRAGVVFEKGVMAERSEADETRLPRRPTETSPTGIDYFSSISQVCLCRFRRPSGAETRSLHP